MTVEGRFAPLPETRSGKLLLCGLGICALAAGATTIPTKSGYLNMLIDDGRFAQAAATIETAAHDRGSLEGLYRLAAQRGDQVAAEAALLALRDGDPLDQSAADQLAKYYADHGRMADYRDVLERADDPAKLSAKQRSELVALLRYEGLVDRERMVLQGLLEAGLSDVDGRRRLAMLDVAAGDDRNALALLADIEADTGLARDELLTLLSLLLDDGSADKARDVLDRRLSLRPDAALVEWFDDALDVRGLPRRRSMP